MIDKMSLILLHLTLIYWDILGIGAEIVVDSLIFEEVYIPMIIEGICIPPPLWCMFKLFTYLTLLLGVPTELCLVHLASQWGCKCFHVSVVS